MDSKKIEISKVELQKLFETLTHYPQISKEQVESEMKKMFGEEVFKSNVMDRVKTFEDACRELNIDPVKWLEENETNKMDAHVLAYLKLCIIAKALRGSWKPNWANTDEWKYYPWFKIVPAVVGHANDGSGLGVSVLHSTGVASYSNALYGGALASETEEIAIYFGKQFAEIWKEYLLAEV